MYIRPVCTTFIFLCTYRWFRGQRSEVSMHGCKYLTDFYHSDGSSGRSSVSLLFIMYSMSLLYQSAQ